MKLYLLAAVAVILSAVSGCEEFEEKYASGAGYRLSFSADTLSFDTLFSGVSSATRILMVYNRYERPLDIASVRLDGAGKTGFRVNVDGRKGTQFEHVLLRPGDSLYVLVEATLPANGGLLPQLAADYLRFVLNGQSQAVRLEAYGQDATFFRGGHTFLADTTLTAERPFLVYDSLVVAAGVHLHLDAGVTLYMHDRANITVRGQLTAEGTAEAPVTLRGDRLDYVLDTVLRYDSEPAQWGGLTFHPTSDGNELRHTIIRNGSSCLTLLPSSPGQSTLKLFDCQLTNSDGNLLTATHWSIEAGNTELTNAAGTVVHLTGGDNSFTHCTIANHFLFSRNDTASYTLFLSGKAAEGGSLVARFDNCLIDGNRSAGSEILIDETDGEGYDLSFNHCVLKAHADSLSPYFSDYVGCIYITESPRYRKSGRLEEQYTFDFRLDTVTAPGIGLANPEFSAQYPFDRYGVIRLEGEHAPTIGAYEFTPFGCFTDGRSN